MGNAVKDEIAERIDQKDAKEIQRHSGAASASLSGQKP
jgi:hypothetical protein